MGKLTLILIVGLTITFGIISWSLSRSNITTAETTLGYYKFSTSRNISRSAINLKLRKIDDGFPVGESIFGNMMGGTFRVDSIFSRNDSIGFRSLATFNDTIYKIRVMFQRDPKPFPKVSAAVGIRVNNVNFDMSGQSQINGNNHDLNGNLIVPSVPANNVNGVEVMIPPDSVEAAQDASKIFGEPSKIRINPNMENPAAFVLEYIFGADFVYGPGTYTTGQTWGSAQNPAIVYVDGSSGTVHFSGKCVGWGILVVRGSLKATGQFNFYGLVIPFSDTIIDFDPFSGKAEIVGAVLMGGATGSSFELKGQATVKYSKESLQKAKMIGKLMYYKVLSWYEDY